MCTSTNYGENLFSGEKQIGSDLHFFTRILLKDLYSHILYNKNGKNIYL